MLPVIIGIVAVVIVAVVLIVVLNRKESFRNVLVNDHAGTVSLERKESSMEIAKDMRLIPKDFVSVEDASSLDLLVDDDKHIAVRSNTEFTVDATGNPEKGLVTINITSGKTYIKIDHPLNEKDGFQVTTPNATISVRGTIFTVDYDPARGLTRVECVEGKVNVAALSGDEIDLVAGESAEVVDVITVGTIQQNEMDAIVHVFEGGDGSVIIEEEAEETAAPFDDGLGDVADDGEATIFEAVVLRESDSDIANANVGDIVFYGEYNEMPLAWDVLSMEDGEAYLICSNTMPPRVFDQPGADYKTAVPVSYEDSALRDYLINELQYEIFTEDELLLLSDRPLEMNSAEEYYRSLNIDNDYYKLSPASGEIRDKIFLPSVYELLVYYDAYPAEGLTYVYDAATTPMNGGKVGCWWLRTGGFQYGNRQMCVYNDWIDGGGMVYSVDWIEVRPAIRVRYDVSKRTVSSTPENTEAETYSVMDLSGWYYTDEDLAISDQLEIVPKGDGTFSISLYIWRQDNFENQTGIVDENGNIIFSGAPSGIISIDRGKLKVELTSTKGYLKEGMVRYFMLP
ncbi:MAG: FecR family protein [Lachnospiraceae bacterium]|nr:FecR family protein [Lachnospiraceae bacterium]